MMAITNDYATLAEIKAELRIPDAQDDALIEQSIETASRLIDDTTGRRFYQETGVTRYYTARDVGALFVDDLVSVTTLATDLGGDRTYSEVWAPADFDLEPINAALEGKPYLWICPAPLSARWFPHYRKSVKLVGTFGWPAVPPQVKRACRIQAARYVRRRDAIFGVIGSADMGQMQVIPTLDPDVKLLIQPLMRPGISAI